MMNYHKKGHFLVEYVVLMVMCHACLFVQEKLYKLSDLLFKRIKDEGYTQLIAEPTNRILSLWSTTNVENYARLRSWR